MTGGADFENPPLFAARL